MELDDITEKIIGCGFLEKIYENALVYELRKQGLAVAQQYPLQVTSETTCRG